MVNTNRSIYNNQSILQKRWKKFKSLKRGYFSLIILLSLYFISFLLPLIINNRALIVRYNDKYFFPIVTGYIPGKIFDQDVPGETRYRKLKTEFEKNINNKNWV